MAKEIERKFLLLNDDWRDAVEKVTRYSQGYIVGSEKASVRVRIEGEKAFLNIKSATLGIERHEYQYPMPVAEAEEILNLLCEKPLIDKNRYIVNYGNHEWEIDEFLGDNQGLVVAEIELNNEDEVFEKPSWLGNEVSDDKRYYNVCLVKHPYKDWS